MHSLRIIVLLITGVAGGFAGLTAYLISYDEYLHHFPDKKNPRKLALETGIFAFMFFICIGLILAIFLPQLVSK